MPSTTVVGWLLFGPRPRIDSRALRRAAVWPLAWLAYTLVHGELSRWYPYPFVDATSHGYARVLLNMLGVLVVFVLVAGVFLFGDRRLPRPVTAEHRQAV